MYIYRTWTWQFIRKSFTSKIKSELWLFQPDLRETNEPTLNSLNSSTKRINLPLCRSITLTAWLDMPQIILRQETDGRNEYFAKSTLNAKINPST